MSAIDDRFREKFVFVSELGDFAEGRVLVTFSVKSGRCRALNNAVFNVRQDRSEFKAATATLTLGIGAGELKLVLKSIAGEGRAGDDIAFTRSPSLSTIAVLSSKAILIFLQVRSMVSRVGALENINIQHKAQA